MAVIRARTAGARTLPPAARLTQADLDVVPVTEAIARVTRVVAAAGSKYAALVSVIGTDYADDMAQRIQVMIQELLRRGIDDGTFRGDLSADELGFLLGYLLQAAARMAAEDLAGVEKAAALVTTVFLHGTQNGSTVHVAGGAGGGDQNP